MVAKKSEPKFALEQLKKAKVFKNRTDALQACVKDGEELTVDEATERLEEFMNTVATVENATENVATENVVDEKGVVL